MILRLQPVLNNTHGTESITPPQVLFSAGDAEGWLVSSDKSEWCRGGAAEINKERGRGGSCGISELFLVCKNTISEKGPE